MSMKDVKFKTPHKTANGVVDIVSESFGLNLSGKTRLALTGGLAIKSEETVRQGLLNVLKLLIDDYKK